MSSRPDANPVSGSMNEAPVREGEVLPASTGSSGCSAWAAWASSSRRRTCSSTSASRIKFLLPEALDNADAVARFPREARAAVQDQERARRARHRRRHARDRRAVHGDGVPRGARPLAGRSRAAARCRRRGGRLRARRPARRSPRRTRSASSTAISSRRTSSSSRRRRRHAAASRCSTSASPR